MADLILTTFDWVPAVSRSDCKVSHLATTSGGDGWLVHLLQTSCFDTSRHTIIGVADGRLHV